MTAALAIVLSGLVLAIGMLHAYWGLGGVWPATSAERLAKAAVGTPGITRMPPPRSCFAVAAVLAGVATWPILAARLLSEPWPRWLTLIAGFAIAAVFLGRGIAGYTSVWRRHFCEQPFSRLDAVVYSPLCLALSAGFFTILLAGGPQ